MSQPPVVTVYYQPEEKEKIVIVPNPVQVQGGIKTLVWLQEAAPSTPWRFSEILFKSPLPFRNVIVQDRVVTAVDVNESKETVEYTICIVDETTRDIICKDPQIENEFP